ncbi:MAG: non-heme iron oxygenase ferredoxin subunit [Dehalococcoidia bacterium]|nr:non-heme iron oxygenase ferredoxin subunit [Dehalococcoidia bacterium]MSQ17155.1 non-heme iron oxygenase ferredoxin subunit [Dehalococcoidia bacterium]
MPNSGFAKVAQADELSPGQMKMVEVGNEQVLLANVEGTIYACADICSHAYASLSEGDLTGTEVQCPLHGGSFDVTTGEPMSVPAEEKIKTYEVRISGKDVLLGPAKE